MDVGCDKDARVSLVFVTPIVSIASSSFPSHPTSSSSTREMIEVAQSLEQIETEDIKGEEPGSDAREAAPKTKRSARRIRVLVADDQAIVRKGLYALLSEEDDFEATGQADTGNTTVVLTKQLQPDIVLLDIVLGTASGLDIAQQLLRACPSTRIVIFTGVTNKERLFQAMRIGVHGYLQKTIQLDELLAALRAIYQGERIISEPRDVTQVLNEFSRLTKEQERMRSGLTDLEIELIRLAAEGCSNKEIAARQFWSEVTVKRKMQDIYRKLQVTDRAQAVAEAMRMGLI